MLARREMPPEYVEWNEKWGAPIGHWRRGQRFWGRFLPEDLRTRLGGPFSVQNNTENRAFEYPWAFHAVPVEKGMKVVDLGGGLAGFQFVLSQECSQVINVDPGFGAEGVGWKCDQESMARLNRLFRTNVELNNCTILDASLPKETFDIVYSISVIEHFAEKELWDTVRAVWECLRIGGKFVITIDLFLTLHPFSSRKTNEYGMNFPIGKLDGFETFALIAGEPREIYGADEFDKDHIMANLDEVCVGSYGRAMAQCLVLEKK
jgi:2-polyprenyl-3-methyl-5-hydroxy-6-metoxy-1,4-benzoquinol methylase